MTQPSSAMMKETAAKCRAASAGTDDLRKLLDLAACDLESAATVIFHNIEAPQRPRPLDEWHEDRGPALWWAFPVTEAPWCGSPGDSDWSDNYTHWTPLPAFLETPK